MNQGEGLLQEEEHQLLGDPGGGVASVHHRKVTEEEAHGQVLSGVQSDQEDNEPVAQQRQQMGGSKQDKESSLALSLEIPSWTNSPT